MRYISLFLMIFGMGIGNAWGAFPTGYTSITSIASLSTGDYVVLVNNNSGAGVSGWDGSNDLTTSATESEWVQFRVTKSSNYIKLYDPAAGAYLSHTGASSNLAKYGASVDELSIDETGDHTKGKLRLKDEISSKVYYLQHRSDNVRFYGSSQSAFYMVYKVNSPDPSDPVYLTINTPITIDAGTFNGSEINGTTGTYTLSFTFNSCGYTWYFENYKDYYETSDDEALLQIKKSNGSAYSSNQYNHYHDPDDCSLETETVKFDYSVYAAGTHTGNLLFYGYNSSTYDYQYVVIPFTITAAGCTSNATVTSVTSSSISQTNATVSCASGISSLGSAGCIITSYGFVYSAKATNETPTIGGSGVTQQQVGTTYASTGTAFNRELTELTASTTYCVRAYATNGNGTAYSSVHEFTTEAEPTFGNYVMTCDDYHTVTYNKNTMADITGSLPIDANEYTTGQTVYVSDGTISRTGYDFVGWNTDNTASVGLTEFTMGAEDAVLYAVWAPIDYTLTMATSVGGGAGTTVSDAAITSPRTGAGTVTSKHYGEEITVTVVAPAHHTFTGWTSSNGGSFANASAASTTFTMPAGNTTVTASFSEDTKYAVTWDDNGDTNVEYVYSGEATTFPALANGCDMYIEAGWSTSDFNEESLNKPASFWTVGEATPTISGAVTYKAVYRHKYYTSEEFVNGTTDGEGYYLYATYSGNNHYKTTYNGSDGFATSTSKGSAVPVYLEKVGDSYYIRDVVTDKYYYGSSGTLKVNDSKSATDAYKWTFSTGLCEPSRGDYKVVNEADKASKTLLCNSSGDYIKEYGQTGDCPAANYYHLNLEPAYYYKYSPSAACYTIDYTPKGSDILRCTLEGNVLTVKVQCGKRISSWSFSPVGSATLASGDEPEYVGMDGNREVYRFTIIPTANTTLNINSGNGPTRTITFLDGATVLGQTKTAAITENRDCDSYTLPAGYSTASGEGGACTDWTFDGWTATNYIYGQMSTPEGIVAAGTSQDILGDKTWYAVYHKTFAAGAYFKLKYGDDYIDGINGSNQFTLSATEADGLMFGLENDYLYYIDKTTRSKKWVYYQLSLIVDDSKPTSNTYKTTITANGGTYEVKCNGHWLERNGAGKVIFYASTDAARRPTKPDASGFTAYYPKTDCAVEYVTVTYDAGPGNSCSPATSSVESGSIFSLPVEADITYDKSDWTFIGWSEHTISGIKPGAPSDLITAGSSYSTLVDVTLHAVYTQAPPEATFDNSKGGRYIIWGKDDGINYYVRSSGQVNGKLSNTLTCSEAAIFEFVETGNDGEYKIHIAGEAKYLAGEGCGDANTDFIYVPAASAPVWTITETATEGVWNITSACGNRGFIFQNTGSRQFGHYASGNTTSSPDAYKNVYIGQCDDYYTTNPNKTLSVTGNILVTSTNGRMVMAKDQLVVNAGNIGIEAPVTITSNSSDVYFSTTRDVNISKASKPTTAITINADEYGAIENQTVYVHYMPSVATNGIENILVTVASPDKSVEHSIKVRHLPATFAIATKVGKNWYALTGNMNGAKTPKAIQIEVDESSWTAYAPDTCAYQLWPVMTTSGSGDRYQTQGEKVRFSAVNNTTAANKGLWANNSSAVNTINNNATITEIASTPAGQYEWKIAATEVSGTWKYALQTDQGVGNNNNKLNLHRDVNFVWGTYTDGQAVSSDIYLLPISEITPFEFQVVEWYPTKVLIQTEAALENPIVKIAGEAIASPILTNKGGKLWEISGLTTLASNPAELLKINYTKDAVTYSGLKSIPVIISRNIQNVTDEPFTALTKEIYNYADLVVRDGAVLTMNGTDAQNSFYDVTIYSTSKISVPEGKKLGIHSMTFFGGIDEIYNGSTYAVNKYGVPELSLKGQFGTKTITKIDYVMRVDLDQMYQTGVPYDVNLNDITYWDGTAMTPGTNLYVSAYDGQARANKESKTWIWEEDFASKLGAATLKAGIGYTISAEPQSGVGGDYSIIRMPMASNVAANATEGEKSVNVVAYDNTKDETITANNKGWNYLSNPYMVSISGGEADSKLVVGYLEETGSGSWGWKDDTYRYVTIPHDDGTDYYQMKFSEATLKPFKSFFLQIANTGDLSFALASRQSAPARYLETSAREVEFEVLLSNAFRTDNTGLLIAEKYSPAYEINADLEKMIGSMSVYTIYGGYNLAYNALSPTDAEQLIPVGYVAPSAGEYTFRLDEQGDYEQIDHIYLTDYEQSLTTDLLNENYTFTTATGKNESRFAINVILKEEGSELPTGVDVIGGDKDDGIPLKFIWEDKMYILRNGIIYDATGKKVREIK